MLVGWERGCGIEGTAGKLSKYWDPGGLSHTESCSEGPLGSFRATDLFRHWKIRVGLLCNYLVAWGEDFFGVFGSCRCKKMAGNDSCVTRILGSDRQPWLSMGRAGPFLLWTIPPLSQLVTIS